MTKIGPENVWCPWVVPARFDAYKMPRSLVSQAITVSPEEGEVKGLAADGRRGHRGSWHEGRGD